jgi:hypothetical protein
VRDPAKAQQSAAVYRQALESAVQIEDLVASHFALLADELERQGQSDIADMLQEASHYHRANSMMNRALMTALSG